MLPEGQTAGLQQRWSLNSDLRMFRAHPTVFPAHLKPKYTSGSGSNRHFLSCHSILGHPGSSRTLALSWRRKSQAGKTRVYSCDTFQCAGGEFPPKCSELFSSSRRNCVRSVRMVLVSEHPGDVSSLHKLLSVRGRHQ